MNNKEEIKNENVSENTEKEVKKEHKEKKENKKVNKEIEKLQSEKQELNNKLLRVVAEMQNMKKRYEDEIARIYKYEGEAFIKKILTVLDNFERAINMDDDNLEDEVSKFLSGFKLIYCDIKNTLDNMEVKEIDCLNKPFSPVEMEAVLTEKIEGKEAGVVTEVMQKGYMYKDKVIRPAMVKVSE